MSTSAGPGSAAVAGRAILLVTTGSRGDVQPFLALARALDDAGARATVAAPRRFATLARAMGADFVGLDDSVFALQDDLVGAGPLRAAASMRRVRPSMRAWLADLGALADRDLDAVVFTQKTLGGAALAERLGVPAIPAQLIPTAPATSAFPLPFAPLRTPPALNRASFALAAAVERPWLGLVSRWRASLGLPRRGRSFADVVEEHGILSAWSPALLPAPADWPADAAPLGFWVSPAGPTLAPEIEEFLAAGPPPVVVGFGSMRSGDPGRLTRDVVAGLRRAGRRGIVVGGWAGLGSGAAAAPGDDVLVVGEAPFEALLPRASALVHHGGVGTVGAAMRAGIPQAIHPFFGDQPFWAARLERLGVAPPPLRELTPASLAGAMARVDDLAPAARDLRDRAAGEDGVRAAVARIGTLLR